MSEMERTARRNAGRCEKYCVTKHDNNMFRHKNWEKGLSVYQSKHNRSWNCRGTRGSYGWQIETPSDQ